MPGCQQRCQGPERSRRAAGGRIHRCRLGQFVRMDFPLYFLINCCRQRALPQSIPSTLLTLLSLSVLRLPVWVLGGSRLPTFVQIWRGTPWPDQHRPAPPAHAGMPGWNPPARGGLGEGAGTPRSPGAAQAPYAEPVRLFLLNLVLNGLTLGINL